MNASPSAPQHSWQLPPTKQTRRDKARRAVGLPASTATRARPPDEAKQAPTVDQTDTPNSIATALQATLADQTDAPKPTAAALSAHCGRAGRFSW